MEKIMIIKFIRKIESVYYNLYNKQYYSFPGIHPSTVFAAEKSGKVTIICPENLTIGEGTAINAGAHINADGIVEIGDHVHIGINLTVYSSNHNFKSEFGIPYDNTEIRKKVIIKDCVWIGANVSIIPGITIGEGAIVGMGAVVTKNVPDGAIVGGNPAQIIGKRDMDTYYKLKNEEKFY